jgi:hypothetical protein
MFDIGMFHYEAFAWHTTGRQILLARGSLSTAGFGQFPIVGESPWELSIADQVQDHQTRISYDAPSFIGCRRKFKSTTYIADGVDHRRGHCRALATFPEGSRHRRPSRSNNGVIAPKGNACVSTALLSKLELVRILLRCSRKKATLPSTNVL